MKYILLLSAAFISFSTSAQTWVDSIDHYSRTVYLPPNQFFWSWQHAPMLHAAEVQYESMPEGEREKYLTYVKRSMDGNILIANGTSPNALASANGMAFLWRVTGDNIYKIISERVFYEYLNIMRTSNNGVSHLTWTPELWDDTVYMIGVYLLAMYRATQNERYIDELIEQIIAHREKLLDEEWGLWVHGWDGDNNFDFDFCSQEDWADEETRRSQELWGRGNAWIVVTLSELLNTLPERHEHREFAAEKLLEMIERLPELQDESTGHWYQLPARNGEAGNFLESSCTAMFAYGILTALKFDLISGEEYEEVVHRAYSGLRAHSVLPIEVNGNSYYTTKNVCGGTCIGDKEYYFDRPIVNGEAYALAMFVIFGRAYESTYLNPIPTASVLNHTDLSEVGLYPTLLTNDQSLQLQISSTKEMIIYMEVIDLIGRSVFKDVREVRSGPNLDLIALQHLQHGKYFLVLRDEYGRSLKSIPFVIQ